MSASGHFSRRSLFKLASGLLVPEPVRVRAYSFLGEAFESAAVAALARRQMEKVLMFAYTYGTSFNNLQQALHADECMKVRVEVVQRSLAKWAALTGEKVTQVHDEFIIDKA